MLPCSTKGTTDRAIQLRMEHPEYSSTNIAKILGVCRERIRQILSKYDLPTHRYLPKMYCKTCGKKLMSPNNHNQCMPCQVESRKVYFYCDNCGSLISYPPAVAKRNHHHFCNRKCLGEWAGKNFGRHNLIATHSMKQTTRISDICLSCGKELARSTMGGYCQQCRVELSRKTCICNYCGRQFRVNRNLKGTFCSKLCQRHFVRDRKD